MKTYLVDFENVKSKGLVGIDRLTSDDHVIIFYSENSDTISFEMHCMVMQAKAEVDYMKVRVGGKNALDFQLSTLLGYLVAEGDNSHIFIISNDRGFDKLHDFWENTFDDAPNCKVFRTSNISSAINYARYNTKPPVEETEPEEEPAAESAAETVQPEDEGYTEESKTIEVVLGGDSSADEDGEAENAADTMVISDDMVGEQISENYVAQQSVTKPIAHPGKPVEIAVTNASLPRMPKVFAPGVRHPMLLANESQAELFEPLFEEFLRTPGAQDKHALLKRFMRGADDEAVTFMGELLLKSSSKSELHNMLQQKYDNDTAGKLYGLVKSNYYFLKRVLRGENEPVATEAKPVSVANAKAEAVKDSEKNVQSVSISAPTPVTVRTEIPASVPAPAPAPAAVPAPAEEKQKAAPERKAAAVSEKPGTADKDIKAVKESKDNKDIKDGKDRPQSAEVKNEPKKVDNEMKKRLHELLDSKADADEFSGVISVINASGTRQQLYINMMQRFNRNRGRELYNIIKDEYVKYTAVDKKSGNKSKTAKPKQEKKTETKKTAKPAQEKKTEAKKSEAPKKESKPAAKKTAKPKQEKKSAEKPAVKYDELTAADRLRELCGGELVDDLEFVRLKKIITESGSPQKLYIAMLKTFGKKRGASMYNAVKPEFGAISEALSEDK